MNVLSTSSNWQFAINIAKGEATAVDDCRAVKTFCESMSTITCDILDHLSSIRLLEHSLPLPLLAKGAIG